MAGLLGSQAIITTLDEINKSAITQILKLLTYLGFDVLVAGIELAEVPLESINLVKREVPLAQRLHAFHDVEQPAPSLRRFISEEKRFLPLGKDCFLWPHEAALHDMNL